jgi:hypothetical protein
MGKHEVKFVVPERPLGKADIEFNVSKNTRKLGTLKVSKGAVVWIPTYKKKIEYKLNWTEVAQLFVENGK